jgi:site-specific DNA recombinase
MTDRVAIYARFSSDAQSQASIADQIRICRAYAEREGWSVVAVHEDRAMSGASMLRPGYQALQGGIRAGHYDVVLAESLDRFARDLEFVAALHKLTEYAGVKLLTIADGVVSPIHVAIKGFLSAAQLADLGAKTRRGVEGRVLAGRCAGPPPYGYARESRLGPDGEMDRGLRIIVEREAEVIREIFRSYADGASPRQIARRLNADGVAAPGGGSWSDTAIRGRVSRGDGILRNALYAGRLFWGRRQNLRDPVTGQRRRRAVKLDNVTVVDVPALRLIDDRLWEAVQRRMAEYTTIAPAVADESTPAFWEKRRPRHLLTGKVICGVCGGSFGNIGVKSLAILTP